MNLLNVYTRLVNKATTLISNDEVIVARAVTLSALTHTVEAEKEMTPSKEEFFKDQVDLIMGREVSSKEVEVAIEVAIEEADVEDAAEKLKTVLDTYTNKVDSLNAMPIKARNKYTQKNKESLVKFFCETRLEVNSLLVTLATKEGNVKVENFLKENAKEKDTCKYLAQVVQMIASL